MADDEGNSDEEEIRMTKEQLKEFGAQLAEEARDQEGTEGDDPTVNFNLYEQTDDMQGEPEDFSWEREYAVRDDVTDIALAEEADFITEDEEGRVKVGEPRGMQGYTGACIQTYKLLKARAARNYEEQHRLVDKMERAGLYDEYRQRQGTTDTEGVPFLPTAIADRIDVIREQHGIARQLATVFNITEGTIKVPGVDGKVSVDAVNENSAISGKSFSTENIELDPKKWGAIHPFTTEMSEEVGAQYVDNVVEAVGVGFAEAEDQTVFTADGTASFHSITGLLEDANINEHTLGSGNTSFTDLGYEDWLQGMEQIDPSLFDSAITAFHPYIRFTFHRFQDNGGYLFPFGTELPDILEFTEALPGSSSSAADTSFGVAGDMSYVHMAIQRDVTVDMLREATVKNSSGTDVNLATQDAMALRFTARWDVDRNALSDSAFTKYTTAAS